MIKFGTDGWRAIIAEDFTFGNVEIISQALADYLRETELFSNGIVIGYDNRFLSDKFAQTVGEVLAGNGIPVYLIEKACPTPVTAFAILEEGAAGAVMLTASHNPPEYNGIKFIPEYAGPAVPEITDKIEVALQHVLEKKEIKRLKRAEAEVRGLWRIIDPEEAYLEHLQSLLDLDKIKAAKLKLAIDPMFGAGIGYLDSLFSGIAEVEVLNSYRDPLFGGSLPEPTGTNLRALQSIVKENDFALGLALDGDADRFGIIDRDGTYITPNQVLTLLYYHLQERRGIKGPVARTVATTHMLNSIASYYGYEVEETPVGFKYIGQKMRDAGCILGGEESGGLSISGHIPEKDGILAAALMVEIIAFTGKSLGENLQELEAKFGTFVSERLDIKTTAEVKVKVLELLKSLNPETFAAQKVVQRIAIDGLKLLLEDGSYLLVRASGTEPLFRIYGEAADETALRKIQKEARKILGI